MFWNKPSSEKGSKKNTCEANVYVVGAKKTPWRKFRSFKKQQHKLLPAFFLWGPFCWPYHWIFTQTWNLKYSPKLQYSPQKSLNMVDLRPFGFPKVTSTSRVLLLAWCWRSTSLPTQYRHPPSPAVDGIVWCRKDEKNTSTAEGFIWYGKFSCFIVCKYTPRCINVQADSYPDYIILTSYDTYAIISLYVRINIYE